MWATPGEVVEIMNDVRNDGADETLMRLYSSDWSRGWDEIRGETVSNPTLKPWAPLIAECWAAYDQQLYKICVPALITVLEGVLAARAGLRRARCKPTRLAARAVRDSIPDSFSRVVEQSIADFVRMLFQVRDFGATRPPLLNRNWILHGRDVADWSKPDALRLLHALSTVVRRCTSRKLREADDR